MAVIRVVNSRVEFLCVRADHQTTSPREGLTMHQESWAYCPGTHKTGHEWRATGGQTLREIRGRLVEVATPHT